MAVINAGFVEFEITWRGDIYSGAAQSSSAANFGTLGINFSAILQAGSGDFHRSSRDTRGC